MLESLAFTLFKTFAAYMFGKYLHQQDTILIEGAPAWYYQETVDHVCRSGFAKGDLSAIELAKSDARESLIIHIDKVTKVMLHENFREVSNPAELALIQDFGADQELSNFIDSSSESKNLEYRIKEKKAFARVCIDRESLLAYEKERLEKIRVAVLENYRDEAFLQLESEDVGNDNKSELVEGDIFSELEKNITDQ